MRKTKNFCPHVLLAGMTLLVAGCGQSNPTKVSQQQPKASTKTSTVPSKETPESSRYDVRVASGASALPAANKVERNEPTAEANPPGTLPANESAPPAALQGAAAAISDDLEVGELTMPTVALSQAHTDTCLVLVGDQFPDLELTDTRGAKQSLSKRLGSRLTVVAFWNGSQPAALEELADLQSRVVDRFGSQGVAVIGINSGDNPRLAQELAQHAKAKYADCYDPDGSALARIATAKIPRTYLLDASGKIVWFDLEYSRTTRRQLAQAIRFSLAHQ